MVAIDRRPQVFLHIPGTETEPHAPAISILQIWEVPYTDSTHIPLASDRAEAKLTEGIDWEYQACPFPNSSSRYPQGHPHSIPMSGLERKRLGDHYGTILSNAAKLRNGYINTVLEPRKINLTRSLSAGELRNFLLGLMYLPHYLSLRVQNPIPPQDQLHPAIILLSNSASGTLGALEAYIERRGENPQTLRKIPDAQEMIEAAEQKGTIVGDKTICVASPDQMRHFMNALIHGPTHANGQFDIPFLFDTSEARPFLIFGNEAYLANCTLSDFRTLDKKTAETVEPHLRKKHNPRRIKPYIDSFVRQSKSVLANLDMREVAINQALGRRGRSPGITLDMLESHEFKMPSILRQLR